MTLLGTLTVLATGVLAELELLFWLSPTFSIGAAQLEQANENAKQLSADVLNFIVKPEKQLRYNKLKTCQRVLGFIYKPYAIESNTNLQSCIIILALK
ncbi:MAG: hypothetical protein QM666_11035 [Acinetobacter sp.]